MNPRKLACWYALQVADLWTCPRYLRNYLKSGDPVRHRRAAESQIGIHTLRYATWDAAWVAAHARTRDNAWRAIKKAAANEARDAARAACRDNDEDALHLAARASASAQAWHAVLPLVSQAPVSPDPDAMARWEAIRDAAWAVAYDIAYAKDPDPKGGPGSSRGWGGSVSQTPA